MVARKFAAVASLQGKTAEECVEIHESNGRSYEKVAASDPDVASGQHLETAAGAIAESRKDISPQKGFKTTLRVRALFSSCACLLGVNSTLQASTQEFVSFVVRRLFSRSDCGPVRKYAVSTEQPVKSR